MTTAETKETVNALNAVTAAVEQIKNDELQHFPAAATFGDCVRQGDIYIQLIEPFEGAPELYTEMEAPELQLAPGDTKGSRHRLATAEGVTMYAPLNTDLAITRHYIKKNKLDIDTEDVDACRSLYWGWGRKEYISSSAWANAKERINELEAALQLAGPVFRLDTPNVVQHPEHGDWALPAGCYRIIYQRTLNDKREITRVMD